MRPAPPPLAPLGLCLALMACGLVAVGSGSGCGYTWGAEGRASLPQRGVSLEDLTGAPGLALAFERAARGGLSGCLGVRSARLAWGGSQRPLPLYAPPPAHTRRAHQRSLPPPTLETLTLELSFEGEPPIRVEAPCPRLSAPLDAHPSIAERALSGPSALEEVAALLARKAGDACALRR
jgi:hypothetical protein